MEVLRECTKFCVYTDLFNLLKMYGYFFFFCNEVLITTVDSDDSVNHSFNFFYCSGIA